jgi:arylsulfatase A-like enzyme
MIQVARQHRAATFTARWGAVTAVLCIAHVLLAFVIPDAPLRGAAATPVIQWALLSQEFIALGMLAVLPSLPGTWYTRTFFAGIVVLLLIGSWVVFVATDRFPGVDGVRFLFTVPEQSFEHLLQMRSALLLSLPAMLVAGTVLLYLLGRYAELQADARSSKSLVLISAAIVGGSLVFRGVTAFTLSNDDQELYDPRTGVNYRADLYWRAEWEDRGGPVSTLLESAVAALGSRDAPIGANANVPVDRPPRQPGELVHTGTPAHRWNVLIIEVESMRSRALRAGGSPVVVMPAVEAIAKDSRRYADAYTTATQTNLAAVVPLSGQYPLRYHRPQAYPVRSGYPKELLYELLAPLGWRAGIFSSQNESWYGMVNFLRSPALDTLLNAENYTGHTLVPAQDLAFAEFVTKAKRSGKIDDHDTVVEAIRWLEHAHEQPFFLYLNLQTSHIPYATPPGAPHRFGHEPSFPLMFGRFPADSLHVVINQYRSALAYTDAQIDMLRTALVADNRWDSTIVIITGDHGQAFLEHGVAAHANGLWQEEIRVPLIIRAPGFAAGNDARPASHIDVAPTVAALLGLPAQPAWQGISLAGAASSVERPRFFMVQSPLADQTGVVSGRWKLVRNTLLGWTRFTDLMKDPLERQDDARQHPVEARRLMALLDTWRTVQLEYYDSQVLPTRWFPPRVGMPTAWMTASKH